MAIDTEAKRNSALLDECGILIPSGTIDAAGRQTLVGDYKPEGGPPPPGPTNQTGFFVTYKPSYR